MIYSYGTEMLHKGAFVFGDMSPVPRDGGLTPQSPANTTNQGLLLLLFFLQSQWPNIHQDTEECGKRPGARTEGGRSW